METSTKLGRVSLVPRGEYDPEAQYGRLDIVRYEGSSYLALRDLRGVEPEDGADYMLIAEKGDTGAQGPIGNAGPQGIQGEKGDTGDTGPAGPKGDVGETGPKGDAGETGPVGPKGDAGAPGVGIRSIERTSGNGAPGTTDTYTITMTDSSTATFQVYNGADGTGAGDMTKAVYDPQGKNTDVFAYVDDAVKNVKVDVDETPTEDSPNPVSSGGTFAALLAKQDTLTGRPSEVVGFSSDGAAQAVRGWSNPNLLLNWDFRRPVNRNGQAEYVGACRSIDGWINVTSGTVVKVLNGEIELSTTETAANIGVLREIIGDAHLYSGREITISALVDGVLYSASGKVPSALDSANTVAIVYIAPDIYCGVLSLGDGTLAAQFKVPALGALPHIRAIKVEPGSRQTLACQNEDGEWEIIDQPDYDLQYALCSLYSPSTGEWVGYQHSNPNLLDNWYFPDPINQRGEVEYSVSQLDQHKYTIDRWRLFYYPGKAAIEDGYIYLLPTNGSLILYQALCTASEYKTKFAGKTITHSTLFSDGTISINTKTLPNSDAVDMWGGTNNGFNSRFLIQNGVFKICFYVTNTSGVKVVATKLEFGPTQTLARKNGDAWVLSDPPPDKALELAKCQRYLVNIGQAGAFLADAGQDGNKPRVFLNKKLYPMRATPTLLTTSLSNVTFLSSTQIANAKAATFTR